MTGAGQVRVHGQGADLAVVWGEPPGQPRPLQGRQLQALLQAYEPTQHH